MNVLCCSVRPTCEKDTRKTKQVFTHLRIYKLPNTSGHAGYPEHLELTWRGTGFRKEQTVPVHETDPAE